MHRRIDEVAGHGRLHGYGRRLGVADLAHEDHVGVLPQHRAQDRREGVLLLVVDGDLRASLHVVLDGVLDGDRVALLDVQLSEARVERGGLAAAGRPAREQQPRVANRDRTELLVHPGHQAQLVHPARGVGGVEHADDQLLAVHGRGEAHPVVDPPALYGDGEVAVLDHVLAAGVDLAEDLHHAQEPPVDSHGQLDGAEHVAVDPEPDGGRADAGLDVEIGGPRSEARQQQQPEDANPFPDILVGAGLQPRGARLVHGDAPAIDEADVSLVEGLLQGGVHDVLELPLVARRRVEHLVVEIHVHGVLILQDTLLLDGGRKIRRVPPFARRLLLRVDEPKLEGADVEDVAVVERLGGDALIVQLRPVARAEVANANAAFPGLDHAMVTAGEVVGQHEDVVGLAADRDRAAGELEPPGTLRRLDLEVRHFSRS